MSTFGFNSLLNLSKMQNGGKVTAQSAGSWDPTINQPLQTSAIHAALISDGRVFWLSGSDNYTPWADGPFYHGIWNPDGSFGSTNTLGEDLFCCGMSMLANGNVLLAGGTLEYDSQTLNGKWHGASYAYEVDWSSGSVGNRTQMAHGRWYPTQITLPDGKVVVVQGLDEYGTNSRLVEFYDPQTRQWQIKLDPSGTVTYCVGTGAEAYYPEAGKTCYGPGAAPFLSLYPRMHLMPSGLIASVGAGVDDRVYDPSTGKWVFRGTTIVRHYGTSVLLPLENTDTEKGKILVCGGSTPTATDDATKVAEIATPSGTNGLARRNTQSMNYARKHLNPVILPTGQIVIFGGNLRGAQSPVLYPEMFDPVSETWSLLPAATVPRMYHGLALLLQDGRVWTAGTTPNAQTKEIRVEIFKPWYVSETRPTISDGVTGGAYGGTITIPTQNAADINKVSLIRVSATTHHYNTDQRLIWLQITSKTSSSVTVKAPINNKLAPPGYYLVHVLNGAGVPSTGKFIKIPGSADVPTDTTIPTVAITSPANSATISGPSTGVTINVAGTASDNSGGSGIQKVEVQVGSANQFKLATPSGPGGSQDWSTWSASDIVTTEGSHTITARATDNAGNTNNATITVTVAFSVSGGTYTSIYSATGANNYGALNTGGLKRAGEYMHKSTTFNSALIGQSVKRVNVILRRAGNPTGTISVVVRRFSDDSIVHTFGTIDASTLTTNDKTFTLESTSSYSIAANDRVLVEWGGTSSSKDQVRVKKTGNDASGGLDGQNTKWVQYQTSYVLQGNYDLAGEWFKLT
ncbi:MAG: galactose oxidase-like domain-containing protein [Nitrososphaera sp.]